MRSKRACALGVLGAILLSVCEAGAMGEPRASDVRLSNDFASLSLDGGYLLSNNAWNRDAAHGPHQQAIFRREIEGKTVFGWQWRWPSSDGVVAYPEVIYGDSPWDRKPRKQAADLPLRVGSRSIIADYEISFEASGICNLAFEFWTVASLPAAPEGITNEVMIWIDNRDMTPAGSWADTFSLDGITYDVFRRESHGDASGKNPQKWAYVAFLSRRPVLTGPLDIGAFAAFLQSRKLLGNDLYVTGVELGNEVVTGAGRTEVRRYSVTIR
jgi:Glycosyl hydrolase family 12